MREANEEGGRVVPVSDGSATDEEKVVPRVFKGEKGGELGVDGGVGGVDEGGEKRKKRKLGFLFE